MTAPISRVHEGRSDVEDIVRGGITLISIWVGVGLLAAGTLLPLHWMPYELAVLCCVLVILPGTVVLTSRRVVGMVGLSASDFALRVGVTRWTIVGLLVAALPLYQTHLAGLSGGRILPTIVGALALCWVVSAIAAGLTRSWATLQVQPWEIGESGAVDLTSADLERGSRVDRAGLLRDLWRQWLAGEVALAAVLLIGAQLSHAHEGAAIVGLVALILYTLLGLLLLNQAARARQTVHWQLSGVTIPPELERTWSGAGARVIVAAMLGLGVLLLIRALDVAHTVVNWVAVSILLPLLGPLLRWLQHLGSTMGGVCTTSSACGSPGGGRKITPPPRPVPPQPQHPTNLNLDWLLHLWPFAAAGLVLLILVTTYWRTRGSTTKLGIWREMLAILRNDLRLLFRFLWRPARKLIVRAAERALVTSTRRMRAARRRDRTAWDTPRRTIIGLYLSALAFAARRKHPRRPGQTPLEYAGELAERLPAGRNTLNSMTELFVSVRYGQEPAGEENVSTMRSLWTAFRSLWS